MMLDAFFVALAVFVGVAGHELFGMAMLSRPIVVAPLAGLLLGDRKSTRLNSSHPSSSRMPSSA